MRNNKLSGFDFNKTNEIILEGRVISSPSLDHIIRDTKFYKIDFEVKRLSGAIDVIPVLLPDEMLENPGINFGLYKNTDMHLKGKIGTYSLTTAESKRHTKLYVLATSLEPLESKDINQVNLRGIICKKDASVRTSFDGKHVINVVLDVSRRKGGHDYIPCVFWNANADVINDWYQKGDNIFIYGRLQSRKFKVKPGDIITTYEVSSHLLLYSG